MQTRGGRGSRRGPAGVDGLVTLWVAEAGRDVGRQRHLAVAVDRFRDVVTQHGHPSHAVAFGRPSLGYPDLDDRTTVAAQENFPATKSATRSHERPPGALVVVDGLEEQDL